MAIRKDSPQKAAMREMIRDYLKNNDISVKDGTDVNSIMCDMMSVILEGALDEELDEELGYSKYDYRNKETDNSRNGHSSKTMHTSYGDMDAIHYHVRSEGRIVKRAVYIALGIDMNGKKDVLGMYVGENESAKFWLSIMNGLKNRGVEDILIACVDGLNGFPQAIEAVYPKTEIQQCIIHQIRNSKAAMRMYLNHRRQNAQKTHGKTSVKTEERSVSYEKRRENHGSVRTIEP